MHFLLKPLRPAQLKFEIIIIWSYFVSVLKKVVRKRSGFSIKALNFAIIAVSYQWSGT